MAKVLFVDHDLERIMYAQDILNTYFNVDIALNGWEGLAASMVYSPDLIIFNLNTLIMNGVEAVRYGVLTADNSRRA